MNQITAEQVSKRLAKEVATELAAASSDPETDDIAAIKDLRPSEISDAHVQAVILASIKHLIP